MNKNRSSHPATLENVIANNDLERNFVSALNGEIIHRKVGINHNLPYT